MSTTEKKELAPIEGPSLENAPAVYVKGGLDRFYDQVVEQVSDEVPDLSTAAGRKRVASLARLVASSKVAIVTPGRDYLKQIKAQPKIIEAELREFTQKMDALRDQVRQPLTDWEAEQEAIKAAEQAAIEAAKLAEQKEQAHELAILMDEKFNHDREAAAIEAQRLAAEQAAQAERDRIAREAEIKRQAAEQAERDKQAALHQAELARQMAELAEQRRIEALERAEAARIEAEKQAKIEAEQAVERYRQEQQAKAQRIEAERLARENDANNKRAINNAIKAALMHQFGLTDDIAQAVVIAIAKQQIPHIHITY